MKRNSSQPDLQTQLESLLDQVWRSESDWRLWDRLDAIVMLDSLRAKREQRIRALVSSPEPTDDAA